METWTPEQYRNHIAKKSTPKKKGNGSSDINLTTKAQNVFNKFIRERDKNKACISCGAFSKLQAGHFYSAGHHNHLRFNEDNVHAQCLRCNYFLSGNLNNYRLNLEKKIGKERLEKLDQLASIKTTVKVNRLHLVEIIKTYKNLITTIKETI